MKYCCQKFEVSHRTSKNMGLNIRVIKLSDRYIEANKARGISILKKDFYSFILTEGYEDELYTKNQQYTFIDFCPYCGKKLSKYYSKDEFINEEKHVW